MDHLRTPVCAAAGGTRGAPGSPRAPRPLLPCPLATDDTLLRDLLEHRAGAWPRFLARFDPLIRRSIRASTARGPFRLTDEDRADIRASLLASLFADDHRKLRAFVPGGGRTLKSWIALLAQHAAIDFVRRVRAQARIRAVVHGARGTERILAPCLDELLEEKQLAERVARAAADLSPRQREVFELCFVHGLDSAQVARRMGTSVQTVHSARHKLEQHLARTLRRERARKAAA